MDISSLPDIVIDHIIRHLDSTSRSRIAKAIPAFRRNVDRLNENLFRRQWLARKFPDTKIRTDYVLPKSVYIFESPAVVGHWTFGSRAYALLLNGQMISMDTCNAERIFMATDVMLTCMINSFQPFMVQHSSVSEAGLLLESHHICQTLLQGCQMCVAWFLFPEAKKYVRLMLHWKGIDTTFYLKQRLSGRKHQLLIYDFAQKSVRFFETLILTNNPDRLVGTAVYVQEKWQRSLTTRITSPDELCFNEVVAAVPTHINGRSSVTILSLKNGEMLNEIGLPRSTPVTLSLKGPDIMVAVQPPEFGTNMQKRARLNSSYGDLFFFDLTTGKLITKLHSEDDSEGNAMKYGLHKEDHLQGNKLLLCCNGDIDGGTFVKVDKIITERLDSSFRAVIVDEDAHSVTWITDDVLVTRHGHTVCKKGEDLGYVTKSIRGLKPERVENDGVVALSRDLFLKAGGDDKRASSGSAVRTVQVRGLMERTPPRAASEQSAGFAN